MSEMGEQRRGTGKIQRDRSNAVFSSPHDWTIDQTR